MEGKWFDSFNDQFISEYGVIGKHATLRELKFTGSNPVIRSFISSIGEMANTQYLKYCPVMGCRFKSCMEQFVLRSPYGGTADAKDLESFGRNTMQVQILLGTV